MDANYFMGDYWLEKKNYAQAKPYFEKVLALPDVVGRPIYSKDRKAEATAKLAVVNKKLLHKVIGSMDLDTSESQIETSCAYKKPR